MKVRKKAQLFASVTIQPPRAEKVSWMGRDRDKRPGDNLTKSLLKARRQLTTSPRFRWLAVNSMDGTFAKHVLERGR